MLLSQGNTYSHALSSPENEKKIDKNKLYYKKWLFTVKTFTSLTSYQAYLPVEIVSQSS